MQPNIKLRFYKQNLLEFGNLFEIVIMIIKLHDIRWLKVIETVMIDYVRYQFRYIKFYSLSSCYDSSYKISRNRPRFERIVK